MGIYGCVWVQWYTITSKIGEMNTWGAWAYMIWGPGWPGNFPEHHVQTHSAQKNEKRAKNAQNMNQGPQ